VRELPYRRLEAAGTIPLLCGPCLSQVIDVQFDAKRRDKLHLGGI
jgi:hypothetical protein